MILIPVKNLAHAKQRLAPLFDQSRFDQSRRTELAQAMLTDVLEAINLWTNRPPVSLVTDDAFAIELARNLNLEVIPNAGAKSETDAIEMATRLCEQRGSKFSLVIPGDIPLVKASELELIVQSASPEGSVLVASSDQRGTNAAFRSPCGLFLYVSVMTALFRTWPRLKLPENHAPSSPFPESLLTLTPHRICNSSQQHRENPERSASHANGI